MSRTKFNQWCAEQALLDENVGHNDVAIIEVLDYAKNEHFKNHLPVYFREHDNALILQFDDTELTDNEEEKTFTKEDGEKVLEFTKNNEHKKLFMIHCNAGISRSGAIGRFLFDYFKSKNFNVNFPEHNSINPNGLVLRTLNNLYFHNY